MWYMLPTLEGAVNPQWAAAPDLGGSGVNGRVGDAVSAFQTSAVVWNPICTLLVVILITAWREREGGRESERERKRERERERERERARKREREREQSYHQHCNRSPLFQTHLRTLAPV